MNRSYIFTSESVAEGHPDKICDRISDAVLDEAIKLNKNARVAIETLVSENWMAMAGEVSESLLNQLNFETIARQVVREIGYTHVNLGFNYSDFRFISSIKAQSSEINQGVDKADSKIGAGDQGMMFGYATNEGESFGDCQYMPLAITLAHRLTSRLKEVRRNNIAGLGELSLPDGKAQVSIEYSDDKPIKIHGLVLSNHHVPVADFDGLRKLLFEIVIIPVLAEYKLDSKEIRAEVDKASKGQSGMIYINPIGPWTHGGPAADTGLTGRKIIVDTYGGSCPHGGGSFSGKDPSKVDRSAAYMARCIAKNIVASGQADECMVQLSYVIGLDEPISVYVKLTKDGASRIFNDSEINDLRKKYDLSPVGIISFLDLLRPIYQQTTNFGHFGRKEADFKWEAVHRGL